MGYLQTLAANFWTGLRHHGANRRRSDSAPTYFHPLWCACKVHD